MQTPSKRFLDAEGLIAKRPRMTSKGPARPQELAYVCVLTICLTNPVRLQFCASTTHDPSVPDDERIERLRSIGNVAGGSGCDLGELSLDSLHTMRQLFERIGPRLFLERQIAEQDRLDLALIYAHAFCKLGVIYNNRGELKRLYMMGIDGEEPRREGLRSVGVQRKSFDYTEGGRFEFKREPVNASPSIVDATEAIQDKDFKKAWVYFWTQIQKIFETETLYFYKCGPRTQLETLMSNALSQVRPIPPYANCKVPFGKGYLSFHVFGSLIPLKI